MKLQYFPSILLVFIFIILAGSGKSQKKHALKKVARSSDSRIKPDENIRNGIIINSNGFTVSEAYLFYDDSNPVEQDNKVALNQNVNLLLIIDSGWTEIEGRVYPGSKQNLSMNDGVEIFNSEELFAVFDETGIPAEDARYIILNTVIPDLTSKKKHINVTFSVWDKKSTARLTGSYKLHLK